MPAGVEARLLLDCAIQRETTMMFQADIETMPRADLEALQLRRLRSTVRLLREKVPPMAARLAELDDPESLDDIATLPFLRKADLRDNYPFGLFAEPRHNLARIHASSGDRKSTRLNSSHTDISRMPSSA